MPLGSSFAAPVTSPGPKVFRTFRTKELPLGASPFPDAAETFVARFAAATLVAGFSLGLPDCYFRAKSEELPWRILTYLSPIRVT
jgi:hypothetical protein